MQTIERDCVIAGGGPAGVTAGVLMARAGLRVTVVERHPDFMRDFRGDTIHPSTLRIMQDLGWLDEFLALPHQRAETLAAEIDGKPLVIADFRHLPGPARYLAFMPQWDFLNFMAQKGRAYPGFDLRMGVPVAGALRDASGRVAGLRVGAQAEAGAGAIGGAGEALEIRAPLTIAADGRNSVLRRASGLTVTDFGSAVDVLWMRVPRRSDDPAPAMSHAGPQQGLVLIDRGDYWQVGRVIGKGRFEAIRAAGLAAFHADLARLSPLPADRFAAIADWDDVHLLSVRMDRLETWWTPGLLFIGDAAHAMSPIGGFGVNLAVQDAVAAARLLSGPLAAGSLTDADLARVEARRRFPTRATQKLQLMMRRKRDRDGAARGGPPKALIALARLPLLARVMGRIIGFGFRPERVAPAQAATRAP